MHDLRLLDARGGFPQTGTEYAQLGDDIAHEDGAVTAKDGVVSLFRWVDQFHEDVLLPFRLWDGFEERRDVGAVDVVPTSFALGFEDVVRSSGPVQREFDAFGLYRRVSGGEGVLWRERRAKIVESGVGVVGQEGLEVVWTRRAGSQDLLDFLRAGELQKDAGTFDGAAALEPISRGPAVGILVFRRRIQGAEVDDCHFVLCRWRGRRRVN